MKTNFFISGTCILILFKLSLPWYLVVLFCILIGCDQGLSIISEIADTKHRKAIMNYYKEVNRFAENKINVIDAINSNQQRLFEQSTFIRKKLDEQEAHLKKIHMHVLGRNDGS